MTAAAKKAEPNGSAQVNGTDKIDITASMMKKAEALKGDTAKHILDIVRQTPKPWEKMNEEEQRGLIARVEFEAGRLVNSALVIVAARGFQYHVAEIGKIGVKEGIEALLSFAYDEAAVGKLSTRMRRNEAVLVILTDPQTFMGGKKLAPDVVGDLAIPKGKEADEQHDPETGEIPPKPPAEQQRASA